jgi:hypothetical protein
MMTILFGTLLALLPRRWRESHRLFASIHWPVAGALSGLIESLLSLLAFVYWYSYSVTHWAKDAVYSAVNAGARIPPDTAGFAAYALMFLHPLTWLIAFFAAEGTIRFLGAAFTGNVFGTLPLFLLDKMLPRFDSGRRDERATESQSAWSSLFPWVRQRARFLWRPALPDEIGYLTEATGEVISVRASRPKAGWEPPRVIRCKDNYYRLEAASEQSGPRPFLYVLRRLPSGIPGRTVLTYSPDDFSQQN